MLSTTFSVIFSIFFHPDSLNFVRDGANQWIKNIMYYVGKTNIALQYTHKYF